MPLDREALRAASQAAAAERARRRPTGIAARVATLHREAAAADLPLETLALPPVLVTGPSGWSLVGLLCVPAGPGGPTLGLLPPWGRVRWGLDPSSPAVIESLKADLASAPVRSGPAVPMPIQRAAWNRLYQEIDARLAATQRDEHPMDGLVPAYQAALPRPVLAWYAALIPEADWLTGERS
jgi:hypothetical protein